MSNSLAIAWGGLANKPKFFGDAQSETMSTGTSTTSNWNDDSMYSVQSTAQWQERGGRSNNASLNGVFASQRFAGDTDSTTSHRTILLGY
ncbi:hypothetical protein FWG76_01215 [Candidatus Saccharibacteria bacterium]|nr:hypothetical protein [Candidatus Saccharibacteria bacterium]